MEQHEITLISRIQGGESDAFEELVAPYERKLYAVCLRMMGAAEDAADALQETMLRLWRGLPDFRTEAQFSTWAYRVATNTCLDALRKQSRRPATSLEALEDEGFTPPDASQTPEEALLSNARQEAVEKALAQLPPDARAALLLRDMQGRSYEEVAQALGITLGTVKSRIHRAREKVAAMLMENAELFGRGGVQQNEGRHA